MSLLCPIDFRYGRPAMKAIFGEEARLQRLLDAEAALARAEAKVGDIPAKAAQAISAKANTRAVTVDRVNELEEQTRHDIMAVVLALSEACDKDAARYLHLGATSNDISDTATALQLRDAIRVLTDDLKELRGVLVSLAKKHRKTVILGRTHGQAAVPMTFGLKMAVFATETDRHLERLREIEKRVVVGKVSGAVGTGAALGDKALEIQKIVMEDLGIRAEEASTQIVGRDRYAEFIMVLANIAGSLDKFCTEVRNLQRTEIGEVAEAFEERQVGSSTMAQKENPVISENVCSLARVVRGFVIPALENVPLWHERDLTNSAAERIILPHACVLVDDMLAKTADVFRSLRVYPDRMRANLEATKGQVMAESVMIALVVKGVARQEAHRIIQQRSREARERGVHLRQVLEKDKFVSTHMSAKEIDAAFDPERYLGSALEIVDRITKALS